MAVMTAYSYTAGEAAPAPLRWLKQDNPEQRHGRFTLLMFVHPKCPCSRASVRELERTLTACGDRVDAQVWLYRPESQPDKWAHTDLWTSVKSIPGVSMRIDPEGRDAAAFGARTSGYVLLYDAAGRLCFRGGITAGRGHEGESAGRQAIEDLVHGGRVRLTSAPVFGCGIVGSFEPARETEQEERR
jgi:hypothetical protein